MEQFDIRVAPRKRKPLSGRVLTVLRDRRLTAVLLINIVFAGFFLFICANTARFGDDYGYMYYFDPENMIEDNRIDSIAEVLESQINHYNMMNGRSVAHTLLQAVLIPEKWFFNCFNTMMSVLLALAMYTLVRPLDNIRKGIHDPFAMLAVYLLPWLQFSDYGNVYFVECLAANYIWTMTIILWFIVPFKLLYEGCDIFSRGGRKYVGAAVMLLGGVAAGWSSENGSAAMLFILGIMGLYYLVSRRHIPLWCWCGFAGAVGGFVMMLSAPGYDVRTAHLEPVSFIDRATALIGGHTMMPYGMLIFIILMCAAFLARKHTDSLDAKARDLSVISVATIILTVLDIIYGDGIRAAYINLAFCTAGAAWLIFRLCKIERDKLISNQVIIPAAFALTAFTANAVLIAVPSVQVRSELPFVLLLSITAVMLFGRVLEDISDLSQKINFKQAITCAAALFLTVSLAVTAVHAAERYDVHIEMERSIAQQKAAGYEVIVIDLDYPVYDRHAANIETWRNDPFYWVNRAFCFYYDIDHVQFDA